MKSQLIKMLGVAFITLVIYSCTKMPLYNSQKINTIQSSEFAKSTTPFSDKKNTVRFTISDDGSNVFFKAVFHNRETLMKIMRGGLIVYFDPNGKKGKEYSLTIERDVLQPRPEPQAGLETNSRQNRFQNMPMLIATTFNTVTWNKNGKILTFNRQLVKKPIDIELLSNELNELVLVVKIPITELPKAVNENVYSIGIETKSLGERSGSMGMRQGGMRPGGSMGSPGGMGRRGGMGQRSGVGGMHPTGGKGGAGYSAASEPLNIWFQIKM